MAKKRQSKEKRTLANQRPPSPAVTEPAAKAFPGLGQWAREIEQRVAGGRSLLAAAHEVCAQMCFRVDEEEIGTRKSLGGRKCKRSSKRGSGG